jgi:hypothetical protein
MLSGRACRQSKVAHRQSKNQLIALGLKEPGMDMRLDHQEVRRTSGFLQSVWKEGVTPGVGKLEQ